MKNQAFHFTEGALTQDLRSSDFRMVVRYAQAMEDAKHRPVAVIGGATTSAE